MKTKLRFSIIFLSALLQFMAQPLFASGNDPPPDNYKGPGIIACYLNNAEATPGSNELPDGSKLYGDGVFNGQLYTEETSAGLKNVIFDLAGNKVKELTSAHISEQIMDVSKLRPGIYIVQFQMGRERITKKLMIK